MPLSAADYRPPDAEHAVLDRVIAEHLEVFLGTAPTLTPRPRINRVLYRAKPAGATSSSGASRRASGTSSAV